MKPTRIGSVLAGVQRIGLDSSVLMYHFDNHPAHVPVTSRLLNRISDGLEAILSTMAFMELLVRPYRTGPKAAGDVAALLGNMPNFAYLPTTLEIAAEGARLRAKYGLETPDAVHPATSLIAGADLFITNDSAFKAVAHREDIRIVLLDDCRE